MSKEETRGFENQRPGSKPQLWKVEATWPQRQKSPSLKLHFFDYKMGTEEWYLFD